MQGIPRTVNLVQDILIGDLLLTIEERRLGTTPGSNIRVHIGSGNVQHVRKMQSTAVEATWHRSRRRSIHASMACSEGCIQVSKVCRATPSLSATGGS